jgi:hypothetical protein
MKKFLIFAYMALVLAGPAFAQTVTLPYVTTVNPTDAIQDVPYGAPATGNVYAKPAQITATKGYTKNQTVDTGKTYSYTFGNSQSRMLFEPAATVAYSYVTFAPNPSDGTEACVFSTAQITLLYPTANTGQTVNNAVTTLAANGNACYVYGTSNATWDRSR